MNIVILLTVIFSSTVNAAPYVGYGSSDAVLPAKNQELFLMGFQAGLQKKLGIKKSSEILIKDQISDGSQLGALSAAENLLAKNVKMLVGFPTSHEALLAARLSKNKGILTIFAGAGHSDLASMGTTVFTTGESMDISVEETLDFIKKKFSSKKGLLVTNPYAVFSKNQEVTFQSYLSREEHKDIKLERAQLSKKLLLSEDNIKSINEKKIDYIVLTPYADESAKLLEQLQKNAIDIPIITNSSWTTGDVDFGRRFLVSRKSPIYCQSLWLKGSKDSKEFEQYILKTYGRPATAEIANGYDLGIIVAAVVEAQAGEITKESLLNEFKKQSCFDGLSTGKMCFKPEGGHALKKITFVRFTTTGFMVVN